MDYYEILEVDRKASDIEIKKAYKRLAIKYHPDKNNNDKYSTEKFKEIAQAYEVLSNKEKRRIYDMTGKKSVDMPNIFNAYNIFNKFFTSMTNGLMTDDIINLLNNSNIKVHIFSLKESFMNNANYNTNNNANYNANRDTNHNNYNSTYDNLNYNKDTDSQNEKTKDIYYNIYAKLEDIYNKKIKPLKLERIRYENGKYIKKEIEYNIPVYKKEIIFFEEADDDENCDKRGDLIITIYDKEHDKFKRINDYDLIYTHKINLYDIYFGFSFELRHLDGQILKINSKPNDLIFQKHFYQKIKNKGLYDDEKECPMDIKRGDLYIRYIIEFPIVDKLKIKEICDDHEENNGDYEKKKEKKNGEKKDEDNIFSIEAENCNYDEIYRYYD